MKKAMIFVLFGLLIAGVVGCAAVKQLVSDATRGRAEATDQERQAIDRDVQQKTDMVRGIPVVGTYAAVILPTILGFFGIAKLGRSRRLGESTAEKPYTGHLGESIKIGPLSLEKTVQVATDINRGVMEAVGQKGSPVQRGWKVFVAVIGTLLAALMAEPRFMSWITAHPALAIVLSLVAPIIAGLSKKLDEVKLTAETKTE